MTNQEKPAAAPERDPTYGLDEHGAVVLFRDGKPVEPALMVPRYPATCDICGYSTTNCCCTKPAPPPAAEPSELEAARFRMTKAAEGGYVDTETPEQKAVALEVLRHRLLGIECVLRQAVVGGTVEEMVAQCIGDRKALQAEVASLRAELAREEQYASGLIVERDAALARAEQAEKERDEARALLGKSALADIEYRDKLRTRAMQAEAERDEARRLIQQVEPDDKLLILLERTVAAVAALGPWGPKYGLAYDLVCEALALHRASPARRRGKYKRRKGAMVPDPTSHPEGSQS